MTIYQLNSSRFYLKNFLKDIEINIKIQIAKLLSKYFL